MTENKDQPATGFQEWSEDKTDYKIHYGLTKLEAFTMAAMQGLLANHTMIDNNSLQSLEWIARTAIEQATETLKQLEQHEE